MKRLLTLALAGTLGWAQTTGYQRDALPKLPGLLWEDATGVIQAPGDWTSNDWTTAALGAAAVVGTALVLDHTLADAASRNATPSRDRLGRNLAQVGGTGGLVLMGAGYFAFTLLDKDEPRSLVVDMGIATVLAQAVILPLKYGLGRARPADGFGDSHFTPLSSRDSFPSGHATQAFAMASVLSMRTDEPWVGWCAYGVAGVVGLSRLETRDHFASDVVAGALVGTCMGRTVVRLNRKLRSGKTELSFMPALGPGFKGLTLTAKF